MTEQSPRESCYFCGSEEQIESHHILPQRFGGPDDDENLVDVCRDCHEKIEKVYDQSFWSKIEISKAEYEPDYRNLDDEYTVKWEPEIWPDSDIADVTPMKCPGCVRPSPFKRKTHQPSGNQLLICGIDYCDCIIVLTGHTTHDFGHIRHIIEILETEEDAAWEPDVIRKTVQYLDFSESEAREKISDLIDRGEIWRVRDNRLRSTVGDSR